MESAGIQTMRRRRPKDDFLEDQDEHNQPTEPMLPAIPSPFSPSSTVGSDNAFIPAPQPYERPFPRQDRIGVPAPDFSSRSSGVYPQLPPAPAVRSWKRPAGGVVPIVPVDAEIPVQSPARRSAWPILVRFFFVGVQWLLIVRFVLKIIQWPASTNWVDIIYVVSNVFVFPFQLLLQNVALPIASTSAIEISTLLAVPSYWLLSRLLVRLLKAVLRSR